MQPWIRAGHAGMFGATLLLAACHGTGGQAGSDPSVAAQANVLRSDGAPRNHCDADAVASLEGAAWEPALLERVLADAGADEARKLDEDSIITKEYKQGRVNVVVDAEGQVVRVYCG